MMRYTETALLSVLNKEDAVRVVRQEEVIALRLRFRLAFVRFDVFCVHVPSTLKQNITQDPTHVDA